MIDTKLKQITYHLTGLELKIDDRRNTALETYRQGNEIIEQYIGFSKQQILHFKENIYTRGYNTKNLNIAYIQILLHEVAHYKQMAKFNKIYNSLASFDKEYKRNNEYFETVADRYALRYYKRFI